MALATQCPHCHTTFRVAHDQLKLRAGLVRCGSCKQIFNGIENLLRPEEAERALPAPTPQVASPHIAPPASAESPQPMNEPATAPEAEDLAESAPADEVVPASIPDEAPAAQEDIRDEQIHHDENASDDPLQRMTLMEFSPAEPKADDTRGAASERPGMADELDALEKAIDDMQRQPWRDPAEEEELPAAADEPDQADDNAYEEPAFVKQGRRRQRMHRIMRILMAIGLPILLIAVLAQGIHIFRNQLAARFPDAKPALLTACQLIGCEVGLPMQIETVAIESSELQAASADQKTFSLSVLLGNHSATVQAWPNIELTLNDTEDKPIVRRIFTPRDYLPASQEISKGFAPKSEQAVKLYFALAQLKASGYRVYLFYP
ncbi:DUF3426 domain-containing protein [Noviherbaspirillum autotrophicum]|uniref:Zinc finger/thioredoxin putative domain-containing protein n=1 Tax=Noviherbaspirillum autotrophicum TaxID=709839 RepID=A0A0C2BSL6_9BURK|nr:DUF3426 domain-containing protein [Noviherbaspirillum autotrophicum]KIF81071.1 hypothetical protein TSA66_10050 [Noviherbaspirillum autotrophicum]